MKKFALAIAVAVMAPQSSFAVITGTINADGKIVITSSPPYNSSDGGDIVGGLEFISPGGYLIPVPGGASASAAPWQFFVGNSTGEVNYSSLGSGPKITGELVLEVGYDVAMARAGTGFDLFARWGFLEGVPFLVSCPACVPEPTSGLLSAIGSLGLMAFRRGR